MLIVHSSQSCLLTQHCEQTLAHFVKPFLFDWSAHNNVETWVECKRTVSISCEDMHCSTDLRYRNVFGLIRSKDLLTFNADMPMYFVLCSKINMISISWATSWHVEQTNRATDPECLQSSGSQPWYWPFCCHWIKPRSQKHRHQWMLTGH